MKLMECDHCLKMIEIQTTSRAIKGWCKKCVTDHYHLLSEFNIDLPGKYTDGWWSQEHNLKKLALIPKYDNIV